MELGMSEMPLAEETWSPTPAGPTSRSASTPPSASSIGSSTVLVRYGWDINEDSQVLELLEEMLERPLEYEEVSAAISQFQLVHRQTPTLRQLALELGAVSSPQVVGQSPPAEVPSPTVRSPVYACAHTPSLSRFGALASPALATEDGDLVAGTETPAPRPLVPGLNLRVLKKKSPAKGAGPSPPAGNTAADALQAQSAATAFKTATKTPDSCSPTQILRVLMPTACKPRGGNATAWQLRAWGQYTPTPAAQPPHPPDLAAEWGDVHAGERNGLEQDVRRQLGRLSMDDLDQQDGPRRTSPAKALGNNAAAGEGYSPVVLSRKGTPQATPEKRHTPGSRTRCHGNTSYPHHPAHAHNGGSAAGVPHMTAKRQLRLAEAGGDEDCTNGRKGGAVSLVESDLRTDTPNKGFVVSAAVAAPAIAAAHAASPGSATGLAHGLLLDSSFAARDPEGRSAFGEDGGGAPQRAASQGPSPVPPLRLPPQPMPGSGSGTGVPRLSARLRPRGASGGGAAPTSSRIPWLPLAAAPQQQQGRGHAAQAALPSGARTRRLSICLPSTMVYGEGPLTARRMAAKATSGITSHALCTVFWAESEDELEDFDSDLTVTDDDGSDDNDAYYPSDGEYEPLDEATIDAAAAAATASHIFTAAAAAAAAAGAAAQLGSPQSSALAGSAGGAGDHHPNGQQRAKGRRSRKHRHRLAAASVNHGKVEDSDRCGRDLMLPEELWDAWERLSDGPKRRQYRLLESLTHVQRITCTSYSTVSKACHQGQPVVVKIYDVAERDKLANAFAEIGVLLHLSGWSGAVRLLDYGRHEDKVMLMLESCDQSLKDLCNSKRFVMDTGAEYILFCLRLWCTLVELLRELHERFHVAHCDLKPGNVLLSGERLLLADFSESMLFNETPLLLDQARGTVPYQPPEMVHRHCVDARKADVWAMGCMLYELITGELLFKGNNDCLRAVTLGSSAAARQRLHLHHHHARNRTSGGGGSGRGSGRVHRRLMKRQHQPHPHRQRALVAEALTNGPAVVTSWDGGAGLEGAAAAAPTAAGGGEAAAIAPPPAAEAPLVPRLPLALTHPTTASPAAPWRVHPMAPVAAQLPPLTLPPHLLLSARSGLACVTGRSLELIAEGYGTEDALSMASEPWILPSAGHTAPTTARSTARDTARTHMPVDTARSLASTSTAAAWPPPPPPSAGTARSVADSEWTLAAPTAVTMTSHPVSTATAGGGTLRYDLLAPHVFGVSGGIGDATEPGSGVVMAGGGGAVVSGQLQAPASPQVLPPHRRLRHSVATQCADPAGPDWMTTEEADRMRIMADEPPSFILVHHHGGGTSTGGAAPSDGGTDGCGGTARSGAGYESTEATIAAANYGQYKSRHLSGADGPSLCDDVLGLLRAVLVEDHQRPTMRELARMAAEVLQRHESHAPPPAPPLSSDQDGVLPTAALPTAASASRYLATSNDCRQRQARPSSELGPLQQQQQCGVTSAVRMAAQGAWLGAATPSEGPGSSCGGWPPRASAGAMGVEAAALDCVACDSVIDTQLDDLCGAWQYPTSGHSLHQQLQPVALPRLCLSVLQGRDPEQPLQGTCDASRAAGAFPDSRPEDPLVMGSSTGGGSWTDGSSLGGADLRASIGGGVASAGASCGGGADNNNNDDASGGGVPGGPVSVSLFDMCQPLVTSRNSRSYSRSWQRFLTKQ